MKNKFKVIIMLVLVCILFTACGSKSNKEAEEDMVSYETDDVTYNSSESTEQSTANSTTDTAIVEESKADSDSDSGENGESDIKVETNRKIIRNVSLGLETQDFDKVVDTIESEITSLGGYAESVEMSDLLSSTNRYCNIIARVPAAKLDSFVNKVNETGNVVSKNMSAEDVTDRKSVV